MLHIQALTAHKAQAFQRGPAAAVHGGLRLQGHTSKGFNEGSLREAQHRRETSAKAGHTVDCTLALHAVALRNAAGRRPNPCTSGTSSHQLINRLQGACVQFMSIAIGYIHAQQQHAFRLVLQHSILHAVHALMTAVVPQLFIVHEPWKLFEVLDADEAKGKTEVAQSIERCHDGLGDGILPIALQLLDFLGPLAKSCKGMDAQENA